MKLHQLVFSITLLATASSFAAKNVHMGISGGTQSGNAQQTQPNAVSAFPTKGQQRKSVNVKSDPGQGIRAPGVMRQRAADIKSKKKSAAIRVEREMKESGEKGGTHDINIGVGE